jgi:hypothetical protein
MGKTTLAVLLLRELLEHPQAGDPVPVMITLGTFSPTRETFQEWLIQQLASEYPALRSTEYGATAIYELIRNRVILPVLDGLDEVPRLTRPDVIEALNMSATFPIVLTCRTAEFAEAVASARGDVLTGAAVIEPDPLKSDDAISFIKAILAPQMESSRPWSDLLENLTLQPNGYLARAFTTPFALWLFRQVYVTPHSDPTELLDGQRYGTPEAIRDHLLEQLIPAVIASHEPTRHTRYTDRHAFRPRHAWPADSANNWLSYLAYHFPSRDLTWWHLRDAFSPSRLTFIKAAFGGVAVGLAASLPFAASGSINGLALGSVFGLIYFATFALFGTNRSGSRSGFHFARSIIQAGVVSVSLCWLLFARTPGALLAALLIGLAFIFATGLACRLGGSIEPLYVNARIRGRIPHLVNTIQAVDTATRRIIIVVSALAGTIIQLTSAGDSPLIGLSGGLVVGIIFWSLFVVTAGLLEWLQSPASEEQIRNPRSTLERDLLMLCLRVLILGLPVTLLVWLPLWLGGTHDLKLGVSIGISFGLAFGLTAGLGQPGDIYLATKLCLWSGKRVIPFRLISFLEDSHRMGLLRQVGPVYQFRHAELQDRLAVMYASKAAKAHHS